MDAGGMPGRQDIEMLVNDMLLGNFLEDGVTGGSVAGDEQLRFGRDQPIETVYVDPGMYTGLDESGLPGKLTVEGLPDISRVENQLKLKLKLSVKGPVLDNKSLLYLSADSIAKEKFYLTNDNVASFPVELQQKMLFLDAFLLCEKTNKATFVCNRCVKRELRRASRRKSGLSDNMLWCNNPNRRAIIFKNKQISNILANKNGEMDLELVARIVCYSRHHKANDGFKILFVIRDSNDQVIAKTFSHSIVIVDKKLSESKFNSNSNSNSATNLITDADFNNGVSLAEMFSSNQLFFTTPTESQKNSLTFAGPSTNFNTPQFPSPSSLSDDSTNYSATNKRVRSSMDSNSSWSNNNSDTSFSNRNGNFNFGNSNVSNNLMNMNNSNSKLNPLINNDSNSPLIQRIIPAQGSINGGIEITLLGKNFKSGQTIKFGDNIALSTQCWNDSTMVTYLPPASSAGQVVVTVKNKSNDSPIISLQQINSQNSVNPNAIFTYVDDTDRQLIELALQIVGLKMNGKLEDARNIAKRIVGTNNNSSSSSNANSDISTPSDIGSYTMNNVNNYSDEKLIINVLKSFKIGSKNLNLSVCDTEGRTLLHYASLKSYYKLVKVLISYGAHVEKPDSFGFTPFHFACIAGDLHIIDLFYRGCNIDTSALTSNGMDGETLLWNNHRLNWLTMYPPESSISTAEDDISQDSISCASSYDDLKSLSNRPLNNQQTRSLEYSDYEEFADDENESEFETANQEDHSEDKAILTETEDNDTSLWNRMVNRINDDLLPKYDDLFPKTLLDFNTKANAFLRPEHNGESTQISPVNANTSLSEETDVDDDEEEDEEEVWSNGVQQFFHQQRTKFQNDNMLLFFWIPLSVILICSMIVYKLGNEDNLIQTLSNAIAKYLRIGLSKIILGNERVKTSFINQLSTLQSSTGFVNEAT